MADPLIDNLDNGTKLELLRRAVISKLEVYYLGEKGMESRAQVDAKAKADVDALIAAVLAEPTNSELNKIGPETTQATNADIARAIAAYRRLRGAK